MSNVSLTGTGWFETHMGADLSLVQIVIMMSCFLFAGTYPGDRIQ